MSISPDAEVTAVFWVPDRILAVGWDRTVTEFAEIGIETEYPHGKKWDVQHSEDILCAAISPQKVLATASYNGDIVFWRSETGQPYKKFNVEEPEMSIRMAYGGMKKVEEKKEEKSELYKMTHRLSYLPQYMRIQQKRTSEVFESGQKDRHISTILLPKLVREVREMSIQSVIFIKSRPSLPGWFFS